MQESYSAMLINLPCTCLTRQTNMLTMNQKLLLIFSPTKHPLWLTKQLMARWRNTKGKQNFDLFSCLSVTFKAATVNRRRFMPRILLILYQSLTKNIILWLWKRSTRYSYGAFILLSATIINIIVIIYKNKPPWHH